MSSIGSRVRRRLSDTRRRLDEVGAIDQATQLSLQWQYRLMRQLGMPRPRFDEVEMSVHSQNGEDGILLHLFALLGTTNKRAVELCAADGIECNAANLIIHHGWRGLLVDGDAENVARGRDYYAHHPLTWMHPPTFAQAWLERETVASLVTGQGFGGSLDLLSFDVDGNDYWLLQALLPAVAPRVIVLEFSGEWGPAAAVTVPYKRDFRRDEKNAPGYCGASLPAFVKLLAPTHRLVGVESHGFNAFFVQRGLGEEIFAEQDAATLCAAAGWLPQYADGVRKYQWVEV